MLLIFQANILASQENEKETLGGFVPKEKQYQIPIYKLIAHPEMFVDKPVYIAGYLKNDVFGLYLYPEKGSCEDTFVLNGISINISDEQLKKEQKKFNECELWNVYGIYEDFFEYGTNKLFYNEDLGRISKNLKIFEY